MLRSFLIYLSKAAWAQNMVTNIKIVWLVASRFIAGQTIESAIKAARELNERGINGTMDHLGESTSTIEEAKQATQAILDLIEQIKCCDVCANVSIKLSQLGLIIDEALCMENVEKILALAKQYNNFVRIDMEDTPITDQTIAVLRAMRAKGYENVGLAIQSYLYRSEEDVNALLEENVRFRLIKGAYKEPPDKAYPKKDDVDANFDKLTKIMMDWSLAHGSPKISEDGRIPPVPALGTHDPARIAFGKTYAEKIGLPKDAFEVQMLYGIRRDLQEQCRAEGYPVRIYIPYGTHWYPYFMRRLAERPANLWFFISNFFHR
ncbi:MAG: proline dehydrogenase family protein [Anaerolineales bacterium]|nr:proline dehydrogenase family protein [Anaerolineales bacterium]